MAETPRYRLMTRKTLMRTLTALVALIALSSLMLAGLAMPLVGAIGLTARYTTEAFDDIPADLKILTPSQQSIMYASDGSEIARFYAENRILVPIDQVSPWMQKAIVAVEDRRFYTHKGVDVEGLARATANNLLGRDTQGASTLTQQYVKNSLIEQGLQSGDKVAVQKASEHSLTRKLKEARYAIELEKNLTKKQILQGYLNIAPFGTAVYGVEAAAQRYFSIHAKDLNLVQSATLAGLAQSPSAYDPLVNPEAAQSRRNDVLFAMLSAGAISEAEYNEAKAVDVKKSLKPSQPVQGCATAGSAAYFCAGVLQQLIYAPELGKTLSERRSALLRGGLKIYTTLDSKAQKAATESIQTYVPTNDPSGINLALVSVENNTGNVIAMAQNTNFGKPTEEDPTATENSLTADQAHGGGIGQQTGSSFKPFTLAAWFQAGYSAYDWVGGKMSYSANEFHASCPEAVPAAYSFENSVGRSAKPTTVAWATQTSLNSGYVAMESKLDMCAILKMSQALGAVPGGEVSEEQKLFYPPDILGSDSVPPVYMANAYAAFANNGKQCAINTLLRVEDRNGKELIKTSPECKQVIDKKTAQQTAKVLEMTYNSYGGDAFIGRPAATKTGTTDAASDSWLVGATPQVSTAVWAGHEQGVQPMINVTVNGRYFSTLWGVTIPAWTWRDYMRVAMEGREVQRFPDVDLGRVTFPKPIDKEELERKAAEEKKKEQQAKEKAAAGKKQTTQPKQQGTTKPSPKPKTR